VFAAQLLTYDGRVVAQLPQSRYVANLPYHRSEEDVRTFFQSKVSSAGQVEEVAGMLVSLKSLLLIRGACVSSSVQADLRTESSIKALFQLSSDILLCLSTRHSLVAES
jgi:hypothetical protein